MNLYGMCNNDLNNYWDYCGLISLAYKLMGEIIRRAALTPIFNDQTLYETGDDENEMQVPQVNNKVESALRIYVFKEKINGASRLRNVDLHKYYNFDYNTEGVTSAGWWLNGAHAVIANGTICVSNKKILNAKLSLKWKDRIDANDLETLWKSNEPKVKRIFEATYRIFGDIVWRIGYDTEIDWTYEYKSQN